MSASAVELLVELSKDPLRAQQLLSRPESLLEVGLTAEQAEILASGDSEAILRYLGQDTLHLMVMNPDDDDEDEDRDEDEDEDEDDEHGHGDDDDEDDDDHGGRPGSH